MVNKRFNKRFIGSPDYVRLVSSTDQIVSAVEEAVRERDEATNLAWVRAFYRELFAGSGGVPVLARRMTAH